MRAGILTLLSSLALATPPDEVLTRMDRAAPAFRGLTARVCITTYTAAVNIAETESGTLVVKRTAPRRLSLLLNIEGAGAKTVTLGADKAEIYLPAIRTVQEYDLGRHGNLAETFMLLGFGTSSAGLRAEYALQSCGAEKDLLCLRLEPKSPDVRRHLAAAELWIAPTGCPSRQKFQFVTGDYRLASYTDVRINPPLPPSALKLRLPPGVKRERPQKP